MKLSVGGGSSPDKKNMIVAGVAILIILVAVFMIARTFMGGGGNVAPVIAPGPTGATGPAPPGGAADPFEPGAPPPRGGAPSAAAPQPGAQPAPQSPPPAAPPPAQPGAQPAPQAAPRPEPQPGSPQPGSPAGRPAPRPSAAPRTPAGPSAKNEMRQIKVFGSVNISYPTNWKINTGAGNRSAEFTNGTASFQVHAPDPNATTAKAIAQAALTSLAKGAAITAQGAAKVGGSDAYWMSVKVGGKTARVVGIDGPTRFALYEVVKTGNFAGYQATFDKMQSGIQFGR